MQSVRPPSKNNHSYYFSYGVSQMERSTINRATEKKGIYDAEQDKAHKIFFNALKQKPMKAVLTKLYFILFLQHYYFMTLLGKIFTVLARQKDPFTRSQTLARQLRSRELAQQ